MQFTPIGIAYERSRAITADEIMALKALQLVSIRNMNRSFPSGAYVDEPRKINPKQMTITDENINALTGSPGFGFTRAKNRDAGRPPSLLELVQLLVV